MYLYGNLKRLWKNENLREWGNVNVITKIDIKKRNTLNLFVQQHKYDRERVHNRRINAGSQTLHRGDMEKETIAQDTQSLNMKVEKFASDLEHIKLLMSQRMKTIEYSN